MLQILILKEIRRRNSSVFLFLLYLATIGEADDLQVVWKSIDSFGTGCGTSSLRSIKFSVSRSS